MFNSLRKKFGNWFSNGNSEEKDIEESFDEENSRISTKTEKNSELVKKFKKNEKSEVSSNKKIKIDETVPVSFEKKDSFFGKLSKRLTEHELSDEEFEEFFDEFEMVLLESSVAYEVVEKIKENLRSKLVGKSFKKKDVEEKVRFALCESLNEILIVFGKDFVEFVKAGKKPFVILFFGINGSGKTTTIAKVANKLKGRGLSVILGAADTFRSASIEQLKEHGNNLGLEVIAKDYGVDPASVAFDAISEAKKKKVDVVLIDTAGRMYTNFNLLKEMEKIVRVSNADMKIFVGESTTGTDVVEQAKQFDEHAGIDGIVLSKADIDEQAGAVLSVSYVLKKPILFLGVGQHYDDLSVFDKNDFLKKIGLIK